MLLLSFGVAGLVAAQARLPREHDGFRSRLVVAALSYAQPLVRSWHRYKTWLFAFPNPGNPDPVEGAATTLRLRGRGGAEYWTEGWADRTELLNRVLAYLTEHRWGRAVDSGWSDWDLEVSGDRYTAVRVCTAQEEHGGGRRLIRVRYRVKARGTYWLLAGLGVALTAATAAVNPLLALAPALTAAGSLGYVWRKGQRTAGKVARVFDTAAAQMNLVRCPAGN
jgi:hypothetical protein